MCAPESATDFSGGMARERPPRSNACSTCCGPIPDRCASSGLDPRKDEVAVKTRLLRPRYGGFLPVDDRGRHAGMPGIVPRTLEPLHRSRPARPLPPRPETKSEPPLQKASARSLRSSGRSVPSRSFSCSTSRLRAWTRSCAANLLKRSSAPINRATRNAAPFLFQRI